MSRGKRTLILRSVAVWLAVTVATSAGGVAASSSLRAVRSIAGPPQFSELLVALCAAGLLLALTWLWIVTTVTVGELVVGRVRTGGGATRRLVLLACGAAILAGAAAPATAADTGPSVLVGLSLPDRSVAAPQRQHETPAGAPAGRGQAEHPSPAVAAAPQERVHVVRPGDSLWTIAASQARGGDVDAQWRAIWRANQETVGSDPNLIVPGQRLRLPASPPTEEGAR